MVKSYIFASLYTVVGMTGWGAYSTITTEDTSVNAIKQIAATAITSQQSMPVSKSLYRWKDHEGNWQYGQIPTEQVNATYEKELELLRSLPREVLPTQALTEEIKDDGLFAMLPKLSSLSNLFSSQNKSETEATPEIKNLMEEAKKLKQIAQQREELLHSIGRQQ